MGVLVIFHIKNKYGIKSNDKRSPKTKFNTKKIVVFKEI
jgi:hypothetical protein